MPFPADPRHLLDPHPNPHPTWVSFAPFCWFHVRGFTEAFVELQQHAAGAGTHITRDTIKQFRAVGIVAAPGPLRLLQPNGLWADLSAPQVDNAHSANPKVPMRFDKACLAVSALDQCAARLAPGFNALGNITICPAIYVLEGFDTTKWQSIQSKGSSFVNDLKDHTLQTNDKFFTELTKGYGATRLTLALTMEFLSKHKLDGGLKIAALSDRPKKDKSKPKIQRLIMRPNNVETIARLPVGRVNPLPASRH